MRGLRQRIGRLETQGLDQEGIVFLATGVPRHDKVGTFDVAFTPNGSVVKKPYETDERFEARVNAHVGVKR